MTSLAAALRDQSDRLTALAKHLAAQGQESLSASLAYHAAELAARETTARRLETEARTAEAVITGLRAALRGARASNEHLATELAEEAETHAALAKRHRYARIIADIVEGPAPPRGAA